MGNMARRPSFSRDPRSSFLSKVIYCAFDKIFLRVTFLEVLFKTAKAHKWSLSEDLASCVITMVIHTSRAQQTDAAETHTRVPTLHAALEQQR